MQDTHLRHYFNRIYNETGRLIVYRELLSDAIIIKLRALLAGCARGTDPGALQQELCDLYHGLIKAPQCTGLAGNPWQNHLLYLIVGDENPFSLRAEKVGSDLPTDLRRAVTHDLHILRGLYSLDLQNIAGHIGLPDLPLPGNQDTKTGPTGFRGHLKEFKDAFSAPAGAVDLTDAAAALYRAAGCGLTAFYAAFRWEKGVGLQGIAYPDPITLNDLIGYTRQKETLLQNTQAFLNGKPANNVLLYGDRGTGKSSTVKALSNRYAPDGLRLVELPKHQLDCFPQMCADLRERARRFVVFIDDLSFESHETEYKYLKAVLEGGVEAPPDNVLVYATSNRRHLIQEKWSDREDGAGEIHALDSMQEKLSLADRFGITVTFPAPDQEEYLAIVEGLAAAHGLNVSREELHRQALQWERRHNVRSGRTARQFLNHLLGTHGDKGG